MSTERSLHVISAGIGALIFAVIYFERSLLGSVPSFWLAFYASTGFVILSFTCILASQKLARRVSEKVLRRWRKSDPLIMVSDRRKCSAYSPSHNTVFLTAQKRYSNAKHLAEVLSHELIHASIRETLESPALASKASKGGQTVKVTTPEEREFRTVYVCYDCFDKQWRELGTGWMGPIVAVFHRLKGHDVRRTEVIPDEGIIVLSARTSYAT